MVLWSVLLFSLLSGTRNWSILLQNECFASSHQAHSENPSSDVMVLGWYAVGTVGVLSHAGRRTCMDCISNHIKFQTLDCLPVKDPAKIQMSDNQEGGPHQIPSLKLTPSRLMRNECLWSKCIWYGGLESIGLLSDRKHCSLGPLWLLSFLISLCQLYVSPDSSSKSILGGVEVN